MILGIFVGLGVIIYSVVHFFRNRKSETYRRANFLIPLFSGILVFLVAAAALGENDRLVSAINEGIDEKSELRAEIRDLESQLQSGNTATVASASASESAAEESNTEAQTSQPGESEPSTNEASAEPSEGSEKASQEDLTVEQQNAVRSAENYISFGAFSKESLISQLEFEGYSNADATKAVESLDVDWQEQAVKSAESYMEFMPMSRQGLIEQLVFEGHSEEDAAYAADQVGL